MTRCAAITTVVIPTHRPAVPDALLLAALAEAAASPDAAPPVVRGRRPARPADAGRGRSGRRPGDCVVLPAAGAVRRRPATPAGGPPTSDWVAFLDDDVRVERRAGWRDLVDDLAARRPPAWPAVPGPDHRAAAGRPPARPTGNAAPPACDRRGGSPPTWPTGGRRWSSRRLRRAVPAGLPRGRRPGAAGARRRLAAGAGAAGGPLHPVRPADWWISVAPAARQRRRRADAPAARPRTGGAGRRHRSAGCPSTCSAPRALLAAPPPWPAGAPAAARPRWSGLAGLGRVQPGAGSRPARATAPEVARDARHQRRRSRRRPAGTRLRRPAGRHRRGPAGAGCRRAVLFDRDGTLVHDVPYNGDPAAVQPMPGAPAARCDRLRAARHPGRGDQQPVRHRPRAAQRRARSRRSTPDRASCSARSTAGSSARTPPRTAAAAASRRRAWCWPAAAALGCAAGPLRGDRRHRLRRAARPRGRRGRRSWCRPRRPGRRRWPPRRCAPPTSAEAVDLVSPARCPVAQASS